MAIQGCENNHSDSIIFDEVSWEALLRPTVSDDPEAADLLAHLLFYLKEAIAKGPEGCALALETIECGLKSVYLYTEAHRLASELYLLYLSGTLKVYEEPQQLMKGVLEKRNETR